jgi:diguanylate cyclase (GGDEF)-like protein
VAYALALLTLVLLAAGYALGTRRGRRREAALEATIDERDERLTLAENELLLRLSSDPVTGLPTQQYFQEFLEREWRRAARECVAVSVLMVEVDHFRAYNDRVGKPEGDACLKNVAATLKPLMQRPGDALARYGGSGKFGVVLGGTDGQGAFVLAERLRAAVEALGKPNPASTSGDRITLTIGVASAKPDRKGTWQDIELIAAAERGLAQAKEAGRNRVMADAAAIDGARN